MIIMCLAIPGKIIKIENGEAEISYGAVTTRASLRVAPSARVGDTALVHAGFVIELINEGEAQELRRLVEETTENLHE